MFSGILVRLFGRLEAIVKLGRELDAAEAAWLRDVGAYDRCHDWHADGYFSAASALRHACHRSVGVARSQVELARKLEDLPERAAEIHERPRSSTTPATPTPRISARSSDEEPMRSTATAAPPTTNKNTNGEFIETALKPEMTRDLQTSDTRRTSQRRLDALVNICRRDLDRGAVHGVRPHVSAVIHLNETQPAQPTSSPATATAKPPAASVPPTTATPTTSGTGPTADPPNLDNLQRLCRHHHRQQHIHDAQTRGANRDP